MQKLALHGCCCCWHTHVPALLLVRIPGPGCSEAEPGAAAASVPGAGGASRAAACSGGSAVPPVEMNWRSLEGGGQQTGREELGDDDACRRCSCWTSHCDSLTAAPSASPTDSQLLVCKRGKGPTI